MQTDGRTAYRPVFCVLITSRCAPLQKADQGALKTLQLGGCVHEHFLLPWIEVSMPLALAVDV